MTYFIWSLQKWVKIFPGHPVQHRNTHFSYWTFARQFIFRKNWRACWSSLVRTQSANVNVITRSNIESTITWDFNPKRTDFPLNSYSNLKTAVKIIDIQVSSLIKCRLHELVQLCSKPILRMLWHRLFQENVGMRVKWKIDSTWKGLWMVHNCSIANYWPEIQVYQYFSVKKYSWNVRASGREILSYWRFK